MENRDFRDEAEGGNNETPSARARTQEVQRIYFVFTKQIDWVNNRDAETLIKQFENSLQKICKKYFFGKEIAPTTGRGHLQGYMELNKKMRRSAIVKYAHLNMYMAPAKGNEMDNYKYTSKEQRGFTKWEKPKPNPYDLIYKYCPTIESATHQLITLGKNKDSIYNWNEEKLMICAQCSTCPKALYSFIVGCIASELEAKKSSTDLIKEWNRL